jgi:hypothetical protein
MGALISTLAGGIFGVVLVVGGTTTYQAATTDTTQQVDPDSVGYADE